MSADVLRRMRRVHFLQPTYGQAGGADDHGVQRGVVQVSHWQPGCDELLHYPTGHKHSGIPVISSCQNDHHLQYIWDARTTVTGCEHLRLTAFGGTDTVRLAAHAGRSYTADARWSGTSPAKTHVNIKNRRLAG